jgi:hypothetical protein
MRRRLLIGVVLVAVIAVAGVAYAASSGSSQLGHQAFLNDLAGRLHVTPQQLRAAIQGARDDQLDALVKAGRLSAAQAAAIKRRMAQGGGLGLGPRFAPGAGPRFAPGVGPLFAPAPGLQRRFAPPGLAPRFAPPGLAPRFAPPGLAPRFAPPGLKPHFGLRRPDFLPGPGFAPLGDFTAVARYLGVSQAALFAKLRAGDSLAAIARERGRTTAGLKDAIRSAVAARLARAVSAGWLTAAQRQRILQALASRLDQAVQRSWVPPHP